MKLHGHYVRPRVALLEGYHIKDGKWGSVFGSGHSPRPHIKETSLYLPLDREMMSMWNEQNRQKSLQVARYQSGMLTEEQMLDKQGNLIAHVLVKAS